MKVKKSSWHYRLWKFGRDGKSEPRDLCRYFWHLALVKILLPVAAGFMIVVGFITLAWIIATNLVITAVTIVVGLILAGLVVLGVKLIQRSSERAKQRKREKALKGPEPPKDPSPFWEYLKARKRKVCPLIQVVDDGKESA
jgi:predicted RND superfamily exporter protein